MSAELLELPDVVVTPHRAMPLRGLRVGNLFVRASILGEQATERGTGRGFDITNSWLVEFMNCPGGVAVVKSFGVALMIADEVSRHAPAIHEATSRDEVERALPGPLLHWVTYAATEANAGREPVSYREWRTR